MIGRKRQAPITLAGMPPAAVPASVAAVAPPAPVSESAKFAQVAVMLRRPGGAGMDEILALTSWKRVTARGRISDGVSKLLSNGEAIWSRRKNGVTYYAILPTPAAAARRPES